MWHFRELRITVKGVRTQSSRAEAEHLVMQEYNSKSNGKVYQQYSHCSVERVSPKFLFVIDELPSCTKLPSCEFSAAHMRGAHNLLGTYRFHNGNPNAFPPGPGGAISVHK